MDIKIFKAVSGEKVDLTKYPTDYTGKLKSKEEAEDDLKKNIEKMSNLQDKLYADNRYSLLIIFQAMDAAGKDGAIKHVMSGLNPQGTQVYSFKQPSTEELDHGYLWRISKALPERGRIGIFNRSHYEEVLVVRVHDLVKHQKLPKEFISDDIWKERFTQIKNFEKYLYYNGTRVIKFFLHISKEEQKQRFLKRLEKQEKNWKFSAADLKEREYWDDYQKCYEQAVSATSTKYAPWYIIPSDKKWFARLAISEVIVKTLSSLKLSYPKLDEEQLKKLDEYKKALLEE